MKMKELAKKYNLTLDELQKERYAFLQCEGYDSNGNEHDTITSWLERKKFTKEKYEPFQKGDDQTDFSSLWN